MLKISGVRIQCCVNEILACWIILYAFLLAPDSKKMANYLVVQWIIEQSHENLELITYTLNQPLTLYLLVSSTDNFCKQFRPRSGWTECPA